MNVDSAALKGVIKLFSIYGDFIDAASFGNGHINNTFVSRWNQAGTVTRYLHQRINQKVFKNPVLVMENIERVTTHIAEKTRGLPDASRRVLTLVPAKDGNSFARDEEGEWWRTYLFVEGMKTLETTSSPDEARSLGAIIGSFQKLLSDIPPPRLHDTIPDFHDMEKRYENFYRAVQNNPAGRVKTAENEIAFFKENEERGAALIRAYRDGRLPERICHNDAKMNNILFAENGVSCVCDIDTVMPGTALFDTGDLIRSVCNSAAEDERDVSLVEFNAVFFEALMAGYLSEALDFLSVAEIALLAESGRNITQIMGLRFLTDYIEGDRYYSISRPWHNLERSRNQIALINSIDRQWETIEEIMERLL